MQATGLKATQPAYNRNLLGILLTAVVLAAVITALIIVSSGRVATAVPAAAPAPNAITQAPAYAHDLPESAPAANAITQAPAYAHDLPEAAPTVLTPSGVQFFADEQGSQASSSPASGSRSMIR